jgi:hypothetical protein
MIFILKFLLLVLLFQQFLQRVSNRKAAPSLDPVSEDRSRMPSNLTAATSDASTKYPLNLTALMRSGTHCQVWQKDHEDFEEYLKLRFPKWTDTKAEDAHATLAQIYWQEWWQDTTVTFPNKPKKHSDTLYQAGLTSYLRRVWVQFKIINFDPHTPYIPVSMEEINSLIPSADFNEKEFNKTHAAKALSDANAELSTFLAQLQSDTSAPLLEGILELYEGDGIFSAEHSGKGNYSADIKKQLFVPGAMELAFFYLENNKGLHGSEFTKLFADGFLYRIMLNKYHTLDHSPQEPILQPPDASTLPKNMLNRCIRSLSTDLFLPWQGNKTKKVSMNSTQLLHNDVFWTTIKQDNGKIFNDYLAMLVLLSHFNPVLNKDQDQDQDQEKCYTQFTQEYKPHMWPDTLVKACDDNDGLKHALSKALLELKIKPKTKKVPRLHAAVRLLAINPSLFDNALGFEARSAWAHMPQDEKYPLNISLPNSLSFKDSSERNAKTQYYEFKTRWLRPGGWVILQPKESMLRHIAAGGRWMHGRNASTSQRSWGELSEFVEAPTYSDSESEYFISSQPCAIGYFPYQQESKQNMSALRFKAWIAAAALSFWTGIQNITAFVVTATQPGSNSRPGSYAVCPNGIVSAAEAKEFTTRLIDSTVGAKETFIGCGLLSNRPEDKVFAAAYSWITMKQEQEAGLQYFTAS